MNNKSNTTTGITFTGLLQIAFIVLKLCKVIDWSWWWVLAPTWIGVAVFLVGVILIVVGAVVKDKVNKQ